VYSEIMQSLFLQLYLVNITTFNVLFFRSAAKNVMIGSGSEYYPSLEKRAVVRIVEHPKYDRPKHDYDAGIAKVAYPFVFSNVRKPIALVAVGEEAVAGEPVVVSGWGLTQVSEYFNTFVLKISTGNEGMGSYSSFSAEG